MWLASIDDATYIYSVPENTINCSGTVTAIEFCYTHITNDGQREVFTLHTLTRQSDGRSRATDSFSVSFSTNKRCYNSQTSCDTKPLEQPDQFSLPASNFLLGVTTRTNPNLPGLFTNVNPELTTQSYLISGMPAVNSVKTFTGTLPQTVRLMWLHISKWLQYI